ncbi:MAG: hypothetical protein IJJ91_12045 [Synergistaceae bacterium]|nr:hypothetical protein [Synergistaceae bacterium]
MKRSRAFILAEQLLTIMLQAGFILVLCGTFYQLTSFYANVNQVLTARNHAERVISFVDDKIRHAGLGLWDCRTPAEIRNALGSSANGKIENFRLPVAVRKMKSDNPKLDDDPTEENTPIDGKYYGDIVTLLYADSDKSLGSNEVVMTYRVKEAFDPSTGTAKLRLIDFTEDGKKAFKNNSLFMEKNNPVEWAVSESIGRPFRVFKKEIDESSGIKLKTYFYGTGGSNVVIPNAGELMYLRCVSMFVRLHPKDEDEDENRHFTYLELSNDGTKWSDYHYQERDILEIYMELDTTNDIFTLYVLASGGENQGVSYPRPESWPDAANPSGSTRALAEEEWLKSDYCHHIVYVSRASWKLNNIPPNFNWN